MNIGKAMQLIREEGGLSRPEMAKRLGMTPGALWKTENGKTTPKPATILCFCIATRTPLARLYTLAFEPVDFAPYARVKDVRVALLGSGAFSDAEIDEIEAKLKKTLFE